MTQIIDDMLRRPASYYQRDWVLACRDGRSFYSTPLGWDLRGPLDTDALSRALDDLAGRHDALRIAFRRRHDDVDQLVAPRVEVELGHLDLSGSADPSAELERRIIAEAERPRALDRAPLWNVLVVRMGPRHHVLAMFVHHLIFDGWSHGVLHDELVRCVRAAVVGRAPRLPDLPLQIGDFAAWERGRRHADAEAWWREKLRLLPPLCAVPPLGGRFISCPLPEVPAGTAHALRRLAGAHAVGLNTALLAAVVAQRRYAVGDDVIIGVTRASRERPELHRVVGPLLDHVPVRVDVSGHLTVGQLLQRVHRAHRDATARALPLGLVRQVVAEDLSARGGRLFDTRYNYLPNSSSGEAVVPTPDGELRIAVRGIDPVRLAPRHTEDHPEVLPLSYILRRGPDGRIAGELCGHDGVYPRHDLRALADDLTAMLHRFAACDGNRSLPRLRDAG
ncbi:hypothetical protein GCM10023322_56220 [Rugosimonospora acidiphila]|uniref:Condensation domain-containing protein n=1 Tax=Rugosimonospora acidiphila TaxID=556531 RepID=A0ABP9SD49_9ACTN